MKSFLVIALLALCVSAITCPDTYDEYLIATMPLCTGKCQMYPPFEPGDHCSSASGDAAHESAYLSRLSECSSLDPENTYYQLTYFTDYPNANIASISEIFYTYSNTGTALYPSIAEPLESYDFGIVPSDSTEYMSQYSSNMDSPDFVVNFSWLYAVKYVVDYWIGKYKVDTSEDYASTSDFKINPMFIFHCLTTGMEEQKIGVSIETLFQRLNSIGVGENYNTGYPTNCPETPITGNRRFIYQPLVRKNRSGLNQMVDDGYLPIVPIAFDFQELKWTKRMDKTTDTPIIRNAANPSLFAVLNSFDTTGSAGAYWQVIANPLPGMGLSLVLSMTDNVENQNSHGIAAFAVGIKLDTTTPPRRLRE